MVDQLKKKAIRAWTMYDWANSAFATTIMGAVLPNYFSAFIAGENSLTLWGYTVAIGSLIAAAISPVLGAIADFRGSKKVFMGVFAVLGIIATALMFFIRTPGDWLLACVLYILGTIGFAGSLVFYDALLPHVAEPDEMDMVSSRGYAMGYIGGGLLLLINVAMIFAGPSLLPGMNSADATALMMRLSLASVAVWWAVFSIPIFRDVKEPARKWKPGEEQLNVLTVGFSRFFKALKEIRKFKDLFIFLLAFFVIRQRHRYDHHHGGGVRFRSGIQLHHPDRNAAAGAIVAAPFAILFGKLPQKLGIKNTIYLSLGIYSLVAIVGFFMTKEWHFLLLGFGVATVQGGSQALSRSLIGKMMPKSKSAEFYGFFSVSEKFNTVIGPAVFSLINQLTDNSRLAIFSLVIFFLAGIAILRKVDIEHGIAVATEEDAKMVSVE
jgi:UMF1 family MFS transporter